MDYYPCQALLLGKLFIFIWYADDIDGVVMNDAGRIPTFYSIHTATRYAEESGFQLLEQTELPYYDFDKIAHCCTSPAADEINCEEFLNIWNLLVDILEKTDNSLVFNTKNHHLNHCYDKIFRGNNLPSTTPVGAHYTPTWSDKEVLDLAELFAAGIVEIKGLFEP